MSKTLGIELLKLQYVLPETIAVSDQYQVDEELSASVFINYCQTNPNSEEPSWAPTFSIEGKCGPYWKVISTWQPDRRASHSAKMFGNLPRGTSILNFLNVPADWSKGDKGFIKHVIFDDASNLGKSEFVQIGNIEPNLTMPSVSDLYLADGTNITHTESVFSEAYLYNRAQNWATQIDARAISDLRVVVDASLTDKEFATEIFLNILDAS